MYALTKKEEREELADDAWFSRVRVYFSNSFLLIQAGLYQIFQSMSEKEMKQLDAKHAWVYMI
jgi:hypothetical protein